MGWLGGLVGGVLGGPIGGALGWGAEDSAKNANNGITNYINQNQMKRPDQLDPNALPSNMAALDQRQSMIGQSKSPWLSEALNGQRLEQAQSSDQATADAAGQAAQARSQLAMRGGLSGGAGERLAMQGMRGGLAARNDVRRQGMITRSGMTVDASKDAMANDRANVNTWAQLASAEQAQKSGLMQTNYSEQMRAWAAQQAANAEMQAGKKDGLFGLGFLGL